MGRDGDLGGRVRGIFRRQRMMGECRDERCGETDGDDDAPRMIMMNVHGTCLPGASFYTRSRAADIVSSA